MIQKANWEFEVGREKDLKTGGVCSDQHLTVREGRGWGPN